MTGTVNATDINSNDANAATMQALGTAARAYASLAPSAGGCPPAGMDASSLSSLGLPAAAIAAIAAAAGNLSHQQQQPQMVAPAANVMAAFGQQQQQHQSQTAATNQAQAMALAALFPGGFPGAPVPVAHGAPTAAAPGVLNMTQISALLQSVGQQMMPPMVSASAPTPSVVSTTTHPHLALPTAFQPQQQPSADPVTASNSFVASAPHVVAAHATPTAMTSSALIPNIQNWSIAQLEKHIKLLQQMNQPVPQSVALLLADARRKAEKKTAKRVANRKSACTSRARKKALVEEMTRTNARLRRQALILSLLPDLVIVISPEGEITFCSAQVERVLRHKNDDLVGADIRDLLIPESRIALGKLVTGLMNPGKSPDSRSRRSRGGPPGAQGNNKAGGAEDETGNDESAAGSGSGAAAVVSEDQQSFPLSVVKVNSKREPASDENENSDGSGPGGKDRGVSSLSNNSTARSPSASLGNSGSGTDDSKATGKKDGEAAVAKGTRLSSSDDSSAGSTDPETGNIRMANENLERNVRWHNEKLRGVSKSSKTKLGHKDDVLGDSVTPNNAQARLSSLQHVPSNKRKASEFESLGDRSSSEVSLLAGIEEKKKRESTENASDDSGYRESNDSREETSSSASESSNSNGRNKPLAPTCNVCLIRDDLTTLWCEVTSSIRTKHVKDESEEGAASLDDLAEQIGAASTTEDAPIEEKEKVPKTKELLLCLRPIRDGEGKVDESLSFIRAREQQRREEGSVPNESSTLANATQTVDKAIRAVSNIDSGSGSGSGNNSLTEENASGDTRRVPPKKRALPLHGATASSNKRSRSKDKSSSSDTEKSVEKSVVESLMLMSNKSN